MTKDELIEELGNLAIRFSKGWHEGIKIDASDIMLFNQIAEALAQEQEPVALETLLKWDDDIVDPIGEVVGFIEGSPYIMVKVHKGKQVSLDDDLYATPPQRTEQEPVAYSGNGTAGREPAAGAAPICSGVGCEVCCEVSALPARCCHWVRGHPA